MRVKYIAAKDPAQNILLNYQYDYDRMDNLDDIEDGLLYWEQPKQIL